MKWLLSVLVLGLVGCAAKVGDIQRIGSIEYSVSASMGMAFEGDYSTKVREMAIGKAANFCENEGRYLSVSGQQVNRYNATIYFTCRE
jgi:hypothetical protein